MTQPREVEAVLDRWFADGPRELSDRALDEALSQIDHTRQLGAHAVPWRYSEMPTPVRVLLVAALMAASAGAALFISAGMQNNNTPLPSISPSPSSLVVPPPSQIAMGAGERIGTDPAGTYTSERPGGLGLPAGEITLNIPRQPTRLFASAPDQPEILLGSIGGATESSFSLGPIQGCNETGYYGYDLSADTGTLSFSVVDDSCDGRASLMDGPWTRTRIEREIAADHRYRVPLDGATFDVTVPASFASGGSPDYRTNTPAHVGHFETSELSFLMYTDGGKSAADRCDPDAGYQPLPTTLDGYVAWTRATTGLDVNEPVQTTVAGDPAIRLDFVGNATCQPDFDGIPATYWVRGLYGREWAVDIGDRLVLIYLTDDNRPYAPLTSAMEAVGEDFLASMEISPEP